MRAKTVRAVFRKEMTDTLRDRRTLISMVAVPMLVIPLLMILTSKLLISQVTKAAKETSDIVLVGHGFLPGELEGVLRAAEGISVRPAPDDTEKDTLIEQLKEGAFDLLVVIPRGFGEALAGETPVEIRIFYDDAEFESELALEKFEPVLESYREDLVSRRLERRGIPDDVIEPFEAVQTDVASAEKRIGERIGGLLPYMVILMCFMGAMYPAIDLAAGEKERGTLETLLVSPASRGEFVIGKYLVIFTAGIIAAVLSMVSMALSARYMVGMIGDAVGDGAPAFALQMGASTLLPVFMIVLPMAGLFGAALLSISIFARNFKEAQNYITACMMLILFPAFISFLPGLKMNYRMALIPIVNASLIIKDSAFGAVEWRYVVVACLSSVVLAAAGLVFAKKWFERESVIFRM